MLRGLRREELLVGLRPELDVVVRKRGLLAGVPRVLALGIVVDKTEPKSNFIHEVDPRRRALFVHFPHRVRVRQEPGKSFRIGLAQRVPPVRAFYLASTDEIDKDVKVSPQVRQRRGNVQGGNVDGLKVHDGPPP